MGCRLCASSRDGAARGPKGCHQARPGLNSLAHKWRYSARPLGKPVWRQIRNWTTWRKFAGLMRPGSVRFPRAVLALLFMPSAAPEQKARPLRNRFRISSRWVRTIFFAFWMGLMRERVARRHQRLMNLLTCVGEWQSHSSWRSP